MNRPFSREERWERRRDVGIAPYGMYNAGYKGRLMLRRWIGMTGSWCILRQLLYS